MAIFAKEIEHITSTASDEALQKLNCFHSGIEDFVYNLAETRAKTRNPMAVGPIQIEADDVAWASDLVFAAIRRMANEGAIPAEFAEEVESMQDCCHQE